MLYNNDFVISCERVRYMLISGRDNPRIKRLGKLISSRKARNEESCFVIEGMRGCVDAVEAFLDNKGIVLEGVYYVPEALDSFSDILPTERIAELPDDLRFEITREIADKVGNTETSQGLFAVARKADLPLEAGALMCGCKYLILDGLQDPGNLGTILRTADAVGIDGIVLTGHCVDLYNPKVVRSTVGSLTRVRIFIEDNCEKVFRLFGECGVETLAAVISGGKLIQDQDFSAGGAVVIGNEGRGLPEEHAAMCSGRISIGMKGSINSLNTAAAATIFLWEMTRGDR